MGHSHRPLSPRAEFAALTGTPNALASHYSRFRVSERLLLTGHSHQAWPDRAEAGQMAAWNDAAERVDRKWELAFARAERVRQGWRRLLDDPEGDIVLGANTHELVVRLLSALDLKTRPRIVTTDGEFHTLRRQLDRLAEEGLELVRVSADPVDTLAERLAHRVDDRTCLVAVSAVLFRNARIVPELGTLAPIAERHGAEILVDTYHALNVVPWSVFAQGLENAWLVGGGYKYAQLGEGNCFLRVPPGCEPRPVITGWYAEFADLSDAPSDRVAYGPGPARFAGATYDPTSHYRASEVFDFFDEQDLRPELLRAVSQHQVGLLADAFDALDVDPAIIDRDRSIPLPAIGGFLALRTPHAGALHERLFARGVYTDHRDGILRLGPAPYLSDAQLRDAVAVLGDVLAERPLPADSR